MRTITVLFALWALFFGTRTANACTKQRCDFLKAFLPFFIILHHHAQRTDWPWPFDGDFCALGGPVVMMFFFISGYGLECKRGSKGLRLRELPLRLRRLFTPTILPVLMYIAGLLVIGRIDKLWSTIAICWFPLPHSWFVVVIAILYVGFYLCASLAKGGKAFLALLLVYSLATVVVLKLLNAQGWMIGSDLAVFVGAAYKRYEEPLLKLLKAHWVRIALALFSVAFVLAYLHFGGGMPKLLKGSRYLWLVLMFAMFAYVRVFTSKHVDFLTKISYDVYLCQGIAFGIVSYKEMDFLASFPAICLLTVALATFSHWAHGKVFQR